MHDTPFEVVRAVDSGCAVALTESAGGTACVRAVRLSDMQEVNIKPLLTMTLPCVSKSGECLSSTKCFLSEVNYRLVLKFPTSTGMVSELAHILLSQDGTKAWSLGRLGTGLHSCTSPTPHSTLRSSF